MGNTVVIVIEASASLRWKLASPATYSVELSYLRLMVTLWTLYILPVSTLENQGSGHLKL